jgi:hypothetical protein
MRKLASGALLWLLLAVSFAGQTGEWKKYKNTLGNFTILFPGEPQEDPIKSSSGPQFHTVLAQKLPGVYSVIYTTTDRALPVDEANFQSFKRSYFERLPKCVPTGDGPPSAVAEGYIGHSYRGIFETPNNRINIVVNLYWGKHHTFAVNAMFPVGEAEPAAAKKFMESFAVIDSAK